MERLLPEMVRKVFKERNGFSFEENVLMVCLTGSQSHGMSTPSSDVDFFGVVLPPPGYLLGLKSFDHWDPKDLGLDIKIYSLRKYVSLLLKNNPNVLETIWLRKEFYCPVDTSEVFYELQDMRDKFSSLRAYHSLSGYAHDQLGRLETSRYSRTMGAKRKALVDKFGFDPKNAAHLIRLYRMGIEFVETGVLNVYRDKDREELLACKRGEWSLEAVKNEAAIRSIQMKEMKDHTPLPAEPNEKEVGEWLIDVTLELVQKGGT